MSPEDTRGRVTKKAIEFLQFGVEHVWIIDPNARAACRGTLSGLELLPEGEFAVPGTAIHVRTADLFAQLDRIRAGKR